MVDEKTLLATIMNWTEQVILSLPMKMEKKDLIAW